MNTSIGFPTADEWTAADEEAARTEGWGLFDCGTDSIHGRCQLQRIDEAEKFVDDFDAWNHVRFSVGELYSKARQLCYRYNRPDWDYMERQTV